MYTSLSGQVQRHAKLEKGVFLVTLTNFGMNMTDKLRKKTCKNTNFRVYFYT